MVAASAAPWPAAPARQASLLPYVPRIVVEWLHQEPARRHRRIDGSVVFADISGFTALTEKLARRGKAGAEEMRDILDLVFGHLLDAAYAHGAGLVKWGGDAVLLLFDGPAHALAAGNAAREMQRTLRRIGRVTSSGGTVALRMSVGMHSGPVDFYLVGERHRELVVTGPAVTAVTTAEKTAAAGEIVASPAAAALLAASGATLGRSRGGGILLRAAPPLLPRPPVVLRADRLDLGRALSPPLTAHLLAGPVESEHRRVAVGFVRFSGTDAVVAAEGPAALTGRLADLVETAAEAAAAHDVTFLATDVDADGGRLILVAGAPAATGDEGVRLVGAVRAILDRTRSVPLRAGVTAGRVFAGDFGPPYRRTYTVFGDCVNLAARLMAAAAPGELLAAPVVLAGARARFVTSELPPLRVKGKAEPVTAVRVDGALADGVLADGAPTDRGLPLLGRDGEQALLAERLADTLAGRGQVVEVVGDAGIGKTRILAQLLADLPGTRVLAARGEVYDVATPYRSMRRLLRPALGLDGGATAADLIAALARLAPALAPWTPLIGVAAGIEVPDSPEVAALDQRFRRARLAAAVAELLEAAAPGVLVLVAEDLHLFDEASADLVRCLAAAAAQRPWLVLATRRPVPDAPALAAGGTRLELRPLPGPAAAELLDALTLAAPLPPHAHAAVLARAAGNPLFLRELVTGLRTATLDARPGVDELPDSIEGVIAARIDLLAPPDRALLRAAAVLGMSVDPGLLGEVLDAGAPAATVAARLGEFLEPGAAGAFRFRQQLVRDTAYEGLPYRRRVLLHGRAGEAIRRAAGEQVDEVADLLAVHYAAAELWPATWRHARTAGARARDRYAPVEAEAAYALAARAAEHLDLARADVVEVLEALGDVRFECGDYRSADTAYRAARAGAREDRVALARLRLKAARTCERSGHYPMALRWLSRARTGLGCAGPAEPDAVVAARARVDAMYARVRRVQGRDRESARWAQAALDAAERCGDLRTVAAGLEVLDWADIGLGRLQAEPRTLRALQIYTDLGDVGAAAHMHNGLGARAYFRGRWTEAAEHYERARAGFERVGDVPNAATTAANLAELLVEQNRLAEAGEALKGAMRVWRAVGAVTDLAWGRHQLGRIAARAGRHDEALGHFDAARADFALHHEALEVLAVDASTAESLALAGRPVEALALADDALASASVAGALVPALPQLHRARGLALLGQHEPAAAGRALRASLAAAHAREARHEVASALGALLVHGLAGEDTDHWTEERNRLVVELGFVDDPGSRHSCPC